jgi:hypothetical protein
MTFIKQVEAHFKEGRRDEGAKKIQDFYSGLIGKIKGLNGFIMTGSLDDSQKTVNISIWETQEDMNDYYTNNEDYKSFVESLNPLFQQGVKKRDYKVYNLNMRK